MNRRASRRALRIHSRHARLTCIQLKTRSRAEQNTQGRGFKKPEVFVSETQRSTKENRGHSATCNLKEKKGIWTSVTAAYCSIQRFHWQQQWQQRGKGQCNIRIHKQHISEEKKNTCVKLTVKLQQIFSHAQMSTAHLKNVTEQWADIKIPRCFLEIEDIMTFPVRHTGTTLLNYINRCCVNNTALTNYKLHTVCQRAKELAHHT